ncbi:MAG: hypothetical protein ABI968_05830 [Acidobacteriota bacterium]
MKRGPNSVAERVAERSLSLGLDFGGSNVKVEHPPREAVRDSRRAAAGTWLDAEIASVEDLISDPPAAVRDYLRDHRDAIWSIIAALEKEPPDWGDRGEEAIYSNETLLPTILLERILLSTALCEERDGEAIAASRALEASWSLGQPVASRPMAIEQLVSIAIQRLQAGVLRKMKEPPIPWINRLSGDQSWKGMLDALSPQSNSGEGFQKAIGRVYRAVVDRVRKLSPCDASRLTDDEIWRSVAAEVSTDANPAVRASAEEPPAGSEAQSGAESTEPVEDRRFYFKENLTNVMLPIRRSARLQIDRELTVKILELRLQASAAREKAWPKRLADDTSVCPDASYTYSRQGRQMEIRFAGTLGAPEGQTILPLTFHSGGPGFSPTPVSTPATTPTPETP